MEFVDRALARRLESAEEMPQVYFAQVYQKGRPDIAATVDEICGGHVMFAGAGSPIGHAAGLGFERTLTAEDLNRVEAFYRQHGAPSQVDLTPLHEPAVFEMFKERGYTLAELNNVLWRPLQSLPPLPELAPGINVRSGRPDEASTLASILARCFQEHTESATDFEQMLAPLYQMPEAVTFVACESEKPVAVAAGLIIPEHKVLALFGAGTLRQYRGRGIQSAMLAIRLRAGAEAGCDIAAVVTQGGTTSQRNCERIGFRVAYSKATLIKQQQPH
jgi:ribosomal protein S18 acetylase RimI-like enzyme